jgi:hypothetical protein
MLCAVPGCEDSEMATADRGFVAWGYVAGAALHPGFRHADGQEWFEVTTEPPDSFLQLEPPGVLESKLPGGFYVTGVKRQPRVGSKVAFRLSVEAADPDVAFQKAQDQVLPLYLAGLSAIAEQPLYGAVVAVHEQGQDEQWCSRMSKSEVLTWRPRNLSAEELEGLPGLVWAARHDATGRLAAREFHAANMYLACRTDDLADAQAILSTYFFVLERIAQRLNKDRPLRPDPDEARQRIQELRQLLDQKSGVDEQVSAIRQARDDLEGLHRRGTWRGIREAGKVMGVPDEMIAEAAKLTKLRNKMLGHPAPLGDHSRELDAWLPKAQACAMAYVAAYLRWVDKRDLADPKL